MTNAHYVVRYTLAALGGPSAQNGEDLLFAANGRLNHIEALLRNEPGMGELRNRDPGPLIPRELLPRRNKRSKPRTGYPEKRFFDDLIAYINYRLVPPVREIGQNFDPVGGEPRIMRVLNAVRRELNIAVVEIVATAQPHATEDELRTRVDAVLAQLSVPAADRPIIPAYKRLSLDTKHTILSNCTSFLDIQNLLYTTRWGPAAALRLSRVEFSNPAARLGHIPQRLSEAWPFFSTCPYLLYLSIDTPFFNSLVPRRPPWNRLKCVKVNMTARQLWSDLEFWRTLGILGEPIIPDFTVVRPSEAVVRTFLWWARDRAVSIALRHHEGDNDSAEEYEIVIQRESGYTRVLRDVGPLSERLIFDVLALQSVTRLVLPDKIRYLALSALFDATLSHVEELEIILDANSHEPPPLGEEPTRLLQQHIRRYRRTFNFPSVQQLKISAPRPMNFSYATVFGFRALLTGRHPSIEGVNVHFV